MSTTNPWKLSSREPTEERSSDPLDILDFVLLKVGTKALRLESKSGAAALLVSLQDVRMVGNPPLLAQEVDDSSIVFGSTVASVHDLQKLRIYLDASGHLARLRWFGMPSSLSHSEELLVKAGWPIQSGSREIFQLERVSFILHKVIQQGRSIFTPVKSKIGETSDNLRQRSSWFKRRSS